MKAFKFMHVFFFFFFIIINIFRENETSQSPIPVLPTIKTPAISKSRSRVAAARPPTQDLSPQREAPVISQPEFNTPLASTKSPKAPEIVENPPELVILDVTNTTVRRSMRLNKKDIPKPDDRLRVPYQQQVDIELKEVEQIEMRPPESALARPKRNTRSRATKATSSNSSTNTKAEPVRRSTRATSRRAAQKRIEDSFVEISEEQGNKSSVQESDSGVAEGELGSKKPKRESISLQQVKMSICKVSLEKVASPMTIPTPGGKATPPPTEIDGKKEELAVKDEQPAIEETMEASLSHETTQSTTTGMGLCELGTYPLAHSH